MDPELKTLIQENLRLAKENNELLLDMKATARRNLIVKMVMWVVVTILFVVAPLIFVWGYIGPLMSAIGGGDGSTSGFSAGDFQKLLDQYKAQNQ